MDQTWAKIEGEHANNVFITYSNIGAALERFPSLKKISIEPRFFDIQKIPIELRVLDILVDHIFQKILQNKLEKLLVLDARFLYEDASQNHTDDVETSMEEFKRKFSKNIEIQNHPINSNSIVVTLEEEFEEEHYLKILEDFSKNPSTVTFMLRFIEDMPLLNSRLDKYTSVEKIAIQLPQHENLSSPGAIQRHYNGLIDLVSRFPNVKELHLTPHILGIDLYMQIAYMYEAITTLLHNFQETTITLSINEIYRELQQYGIDLPLIENNPYFIIERT